ncbi:hypothetical protein ASF47_17700 [Nocardioides sp. Leaf285]|nr:hypothetical protein ASF47_17700 [Nocardioides sp. Leaf285]
MRRRPLAAHGALMPTSRTLPPATLLDLGFLAPEPPGRADNTDPHPVTLSVLHRDVVPGPSGCSPSWYEAEFDVDLGHPETCDASVESCPLADLLETIGVDERLLAPFGEPDHLSDQQLTHLDGTVRYVEVRRNSTTHSGPYGTEYDVEYHLRWVEPPADAGSGHAGTPHTATT